jgi:phosphate-selective porin OprO/OprP
VGGSESNLSLGLNWHLNEKFRVMANVVKVLNVDRPGSEYDGLDPLIFALRTQWLIY